MTNHCNARELYVGVMTGGVGGFDLKNSKLKTSLGYYIGGCIGYKFFNYLRIEEEFSYQRSATQSIKKREFRFYHVKGHVNFWNLMTNVLFDLDSHFIVRPFLGGGIRMVHAQGEGVKRFSYLPIESEREKFHENNFAWQLIFGLKSLICLDLEVSLEYRYFKLTQREADYKLGLSFNQFF